MNIETHRATLAKYGINTPQRLAAFLAQTYHESQGFTRFAENLNYGAAGLTATWPKRFPPEIAAQYARQPEKIANRAYANRLGNGPEETGDGWRFRGHGYIQITGRDGHADFANYKKMSLDAVIVCLQTEIGAMESAAWWWQSHGLNDLADEGEIKQITRVINGGYNGLDDRLALYEQYRSSLA
ncbi:COG3179 Predicted chitinase [uncultured Caudovirales phage]|uniref:COG3179 Predicted chitinase n=1 Tax=uncultured Caudovirales phage TaxID=2100421 RepID=A0A6J5SE24_9CAUD|nr:COG3179 Predicted chitinase [uncultured Caudovirales phage]